MYDSWLHLRSSIRRPQDTSLPDFVEQIVACFARAFISPPGTLCYAFRSMTPVQGSAKNLDRYDHHAAYAKVQDASLTELLVEFTVPARNPYIISPNVIENQSVFCTIRQTVHRPDYWDVELSLYEPNEWFDPYPVPIREEYGFVQDYLQQGFILQRASEPYATTDYVGDARLSQMNRQKVFEALQYYIHRVQVEWFVATYEESLTFDDQGSRLFFKTHSALEAEWLSGPVIYCVSPGITFDDLARVRHPRTYFTRNIAGLHVYVDTETFGFLQE